MIPKTSCPERLRENLAVLEFKLSAAEMTAIIHLDRHYGINDPGVFCEETFNTFFEMHLVLR